MEWSYSRLNSFLQCPYQFYITYILKNRGFGNFFSEYGSFGHNLLERYSKGELSIFDLATEYENNYYSNINFKAPPNKWVDLNESYYNQGLEYFENFEGFGDYKIVAVEEEYKFEIEGYKFKGYSDLLLKDNNDGLHVVDHKSSDSKSKSSEKAQGYFNQMYFYSIPILEKYKKYPVALHINGFRKQQWFTEEFDKNKVDEVKKWAINTIHQIENTKDFKPKSDFFFCNFLCGHRNGTCEYIPQS